MIRKSLLALVWLLTAPSLTALDLPPASTPIENRYSLNHVDLSPDGTKMILAYTNGFISLYSLENYHLISFFKAHAKPITSVYFNQDGGKFITAAHDNIIKIWDSQTFGLISSFSYPAKKALFSPNELTILISGYGSVKIVDANSGAELITLPEYNIADAIFNRSGDQILVTNFNQREINIYNSNNGEFVTQSRTFWPSYASFSYDDSKFVISSHNQAKIFNSVTGELLYYFIHETNYLHFLDNWMFCSNFSHDNSKIAAIDKTCLMIYDIASNDTKISNNNSHYSCCFYCDFNADDKKIITATYAGKIKIYDPDTGELIQKIKTI